MSKPGPAAAAAGYWDRHATHYDASMVLLGWPLRHVRKLLAAHITPADNVLELAAGTGLITRTLLDLAQHVTAVDASAAMVRALAAKLDRHPKLAIRQGDLYALGLPHGSYDVVVASNVLHLVDDLPGAVHAMRLMIRPGGLLIVPTYCYDQHLLSRLTGLALEFGGLPAKRRFTVSRLATELGNLGMQITTHAQARGVIPIGFIAGRFGL